MPNWLSDLVFPAAKPLKAAASGTSADDAASQKANAAAAANPSGIDMAAEAQKAAAKATPAATQPAGAATPVTPGKGTRDHYAPRGN